jgi:hypothetical protein
LVAAPANAGGYYRGGHYHGGSRIVFGLGIGVGYPWGYPYGYGYYPYYPAYAYYPPYVVQQQPQVYVEQPQVQQSPQPSGYWYYCSDSRAYYPYVKECPAGWQRVSPQPQN